jgi:hypothetical protein
MAYKSGSAASLFVDVEILRAWAFAKAPALGLVWTILGMANKYVDRLLAQKRLRLAVFKAAYAAIGHCDCS